jgi:hypothetical protein
MRPEGQPPRWWEAGGGTRGAVADLAEAVARVLVVALLCVLDGCLVAARGGVATLVQGSGVVAPAASGAFGLGLGGGSTLQNRASGGAMITGLSLGADARSGNFVAHFSSGGEYIVVPRPWGWRLGLGFGGLVTNDTGPGFLVLATGAVRRELTHNDTSAVQRSTSVALGLSLGYAFVGSFVAGLVGVLSLSIEYEWLNHFSPEFPRSPPPSPPPRASNPVASDPVR